MYETVSFDFKGNTAGIHEATAFVFEVVDFDGNNVSTTTVTFITVGDNDGDTRIAETRDNYKREMTLPGTELMKGVYALPIIEYH